jgi:hypothetical protein
MWPKLMKTKLKQLKIICHIKLIVNDLSQFLHLTNFSIVSLNNFNSHRRKNFHHNLKTYKTNITVAYKQVLVHSVSLIN